MKQLQLINLRNKLQNCHVIVCGLGTSLNDLKNPEQYYTIGVNDIGGKFTPDFLVVIDPLTRFKIGNRKRDILECNPRYFVSQLDPKSYTGLKAEAFVRFKLGKRTGVGFNFKTNPHVLDYHNTSTYVALNLAAYMGAKVIGLIGVDLTPNHYNRQSGNHSLAKRLHEIDQQYFKFSKECERNDVTLINLSKTSKLTLLRKDDINIINKKEMCYEKDTNISEQDPSTKKRAVQPKQHKRLRKSN